LLEYKKSTVGLETKKIIHLSDTHVGYEDLATRLSDLVTRMIFHKTPAENYVVIVTGDIVEDATRKENYEEAIAHINRLKHAGFDVLVVPGNHDYGTGSLGYAKYIKKFKQHFFGESATSYPKLDVINNIAFIGLDSMAEELHWYDRLFAEGELGKEQLKRLADMLTSEPVKNSHYTVVYLHHHPFHPWRFHQLKDSEALKEILEGHNIDVLLFGHNHEGRVWNGGWGIKRAYDGGTSTHKEGKPNPHRVIDLSKDPAFDYDAQF
jgi:3',5'-cyclic AMP phosphodiesterase CpdA